MNYHRTDYEFEDENNEPNSPIGIFIIIAWIGIMVIGLVSMQSCKAAKNVPYPLGCEVETYTLKGMVHSDSIIEVMPKRKD